MYRKTSVEPAQELTVWTARASAAVYLVAMAMIAVGKTNRARLCWSVALALYLAHVYGAFQHFYGWSHDVAYRETTRQTATLFGVNWGGGLYLNYLFTIAWSLDCLWWWLNPASYATRPAFIRLAVHVFLAFMFLNGTIVVWVLRSVR